MTTTSTPPRPAPDDHLVGRRRRARTAGGLLVLGSATLAASQVVQPRGGDGELAISLAENQGRWIAWGLLLMATSVLQLPAVVSLRSRATTGRGSRLSAVGGAVTVVSLVALFAFGQAHAELATLVGSTPVPPDVLEAFDRLDTSVSLGITTLVALFGFHLGWPLLLAGAARAGHVGKPLALLGVTSVFLSFFGAALGSAGEVALFLLAAACLGAVGVHLIRRVPADRWAGPCA